ncbi:MAG TPA: hypothetical protein VF314_02600 [Actinomycetes bacterium]
MHAEAAIVGIYALILLGGSAALHSLGRVSSSAWGSRVLAGYRRQVKDAPAPADRADWPHSEVPGLYTGVALVAAVAALVLATAELVRHHRPAEAGLLAPVTLLALVVTTWLARRLRRPAHAAGPGRQPGPAEQRTASHHSG